MHDAVADVLDERRRVGRFGPAGVAGSLLLHAVAAAAMVMSAQRASLPAAKVLTVRLAGPAGPKAAAKGRAGEPAPVIKPKPSPPKPVKEETLDTKLPASAKPGEKSLYGKARPKPQKPGEPTPPVPQSQSGGSGGVAAGLPAVGAAGVTGLEGGDFPYTLYIDRMIKLIGDHWFRPQVKGDLLTTVHFVIERDGTIRDAEVRSGSGSGVFDRAALRAVVESSPLPPLPFAYNGTYLGVQLTFH